MNTFDISNNKKIFFVMNPFNGLLKCLYVQTGHKDYCYSFEATLSPEILAFVLFFRFAIFRFFYFL